MDWRIQARTRSIDLKVKFLLQKMASPKNLYRFRLRLAGLFILVTCACFGSLFTQNRHLDSLKSILDQTNSFQEKSSLLNQIANTAISEKAYSVSKYYARQGIDLALQLNNQEAELDARKTLARAYYYELNRDSASFFLDDFLQLALVLQNQAGLGWGYNFYGLIYKNKGAYTEAANYFEKSLKIREKAGNLDGVAACYNNLGLVHNKIGNYEEAIEYFLKSLEIRKTQKAEKRIANLHLNIGNLHNQIGDYPKGLEYHLKVLAHYEVTKDKWGLAAIYNSLGNNHKDQGNTQKALDYYQKSLVIAREITDKPLISTTLGNIGNLYGHSGNLEKKKEYLLQSLAIEKELGNLNGIARSYLNLGITLAELQEYPEALSYLSESNRIYKGQNATIHIANADIEMGKVYLNMSNLQQALIALQNGLAIAKEKGNWVMQKAAYQGLATTYQRLHNYPKAYESFQSYAAAKDSLLNTEKTEQLARLAAQYEHEKSRTALQKLRAENMAEQLEMSEQLRDRNLIVGIALVAVVILSALYLLFRYRQKKKEATHEKKRVEELLRIDQLKDQFLANTSHELRTPLNGIIGIAASLENGIAGDLPTKAKENLHLITASGKRLSNLINDILDFSKLKNADLKLELKPVDLAAVTKIVFALSRPLLQNKPIELINQLPDDAPLVNADENRIQQILHNLIGNAIKFTEKGSIRVFGKPKGNFFEITVSDTGIGIPKEKHKSIFNSFEQLDGTSTRKYGGTGLGLSVSKQLIDLHQGRITVESKPGKGSAFTFTLPLSQTQKIKGKPSSIVVPESKNKPPEIIRSNKNGTAPVSPKIKANKIEEIRILIVDDEPVNRQVLENHLQLEGYDSIQATNGQEALDLIESGQHFDLIILDIMMPRLSGYEVCTKLRERFSPIEMPIIMLTAKNGVVDLVEGFEVGANDYLTKPFSKDELISRIQTHLNLYRLNKASDRFVPHEFLRAIGKESISELKLGDHVSKNVTVMFADIRDYTPLSEQMTPEENFKFVNAFLGRLGPYVRQNRGFINQFLGDGFMAIFPYSENYALKAAIEIQHKLNEYNGERKKLGRKPIQLGIGMNAGPLIMGIIGDDTRTDPATISDTVNTASRMEGLTKHYGVNIIVSEAFIQRLENRAHLHFRYLGKVRVKGKEKVTGIYECFEGDEPEAQSLKLITLEIFEKGIHFFLEGNFKEACVQFQYVLEENEADKVTQYFFKKCTSFIQNGAPDQWSGIDLLYDQ